ncbi:MAG: LytTR family transcriptional regulator DNA-binding domain-containing protein [Crocinitomicaceae bacterium]|nr:LytTR family transcriptional regulator DNA-binding domain-containing protein [Crocinitomicaceae bacterium]
MNWLKSPYPFIYDNAINRLVVFAFVFLFVFIFIVTFKPFQIENVVSVTVPRAALYYSLSSSLTCIITLEISLKFFPSFFSERKWTVGKEILMMNVVMFFIAIINFFVGREIELYESSPNSILLQDILNDLLHTYSIGIFPIAFITLLNYVIKLNRNLNHSKQLNELLSNRNEGQKVNNKIIEIVGPGANNVKELILNEILYIMSDGNYVEYYLDKEGEVKREIQRNSLNSIEEQLKSESAFFRSHRAYIINIEKVQSSTGNAQGYQLQFANVEQTVPVSRRNLSAFDQLING